MTLWWEMLAGGVCTRVGPGPPWTVSSVSFGTQLAPEVWRSPWLVCRWVCASRQLQTVWAREASRKGSLLGLVCFPENKSKTSTKEYSPEGRGKTFSFAVLSHLERQRVSSQAPRGPSGFNISLIM